MKYINKYVRSILHSLSMVCRGGGIGGDSIRVLGGAVVGDLGHISVVVVDVVVHVLDPAVGKGNRVRTLTLASAIVRLSSVEVGVGVVIGDSVLVGVGGDLIRVHLSGGSVVGRGGVVDNRGGVHDWSGVVSGSSVNNGGGVVGNRGSVVSRGVVDNRGSMMNSMVGDRGSMVGRGSMDDGSSVVGRSNNSVANTMVGNTVDGTLSKVGSNTVSSCVGN